jgi:hypothetical protein
LIAVQAFGAVMTGNILPVFAKLYRFNRHILHRHGETWLHPWQMVLKPFSGAVY